MRKIKNEYNKADSEIKEKNKRAHGSINRKNKKITALGK